MIDVDADPVSGLGFKRPPIRVRRGQDFPEARSEGDQVILYPSDLINEGTTVSY